MHDDRSAARQAAFTLIELLVVTAVLATLAAVAVPTYLHQKRKADRATAVADMRNAALAVETYITGTTAGSYAPLDGATQTAAELAEQGFNSSEWVTFVVRATVTEYCIAGINVNAPDKTLVYRSSTGVVDFVDDGDPCADVV